MAITGYKAKMLMENVVTTLSNIAPFFSRDISDIYDDQGNPGGYWVEISDKITIMSDGWAHVKLANSSGNAPLYAKFHTKWIPSQWDLENDLTLLMEIRSYSGDTSGKCKIEFPSNETVIGSSTRYAAIAGKTNANIVGNDSIYIEMTHVNASSQNVMTLGRFVIEKGYSAEFDVRISLYQHAYDGEFQEYQEV